jgi:hypothetical protein
MGMSVYLNVNSSTIVYVFDSILYFIEPQHFLTIDPSRGNEYSGRYTPRFEYGPSESANASVTIIKGDGRDTGRYLLTLAE